MYADIGPRKFEALDPMSDMETKGRESKKIARIAENPTSHSRGGESMVFQCLNGGKEIADARTWAIGGRKRELAILPSDIFKNKSVVTDKHTAKIKPIT